MASTMASTSVPAIAGRYRRVQEKLEELEQLVIDARFECTGPYARLTTTEYACLLYTSRCV